MLVIQSKKIDYDKNINEIEGKTTNHDHDQYITTPEFNKLTSEDFAARSKIQHAKMIMLILEIRQTLIID